MPDPRVIEDMQRFRELLARRDEAAMRRLLTRWVEIERRLQNDMELLAREIADLRLAGRAVPVWKIVQMQRWIDLREQVLTEIGRYNQFAAEVVAEQQRTAAALGARHAATLAQRELGLRGALDVLPTAQFERMVGLTADGSTLLQHFMRKAPLGAQGMMDALVRGLALGWHPRKIAEEMQRGLDVTPLSAIRTARTEPLRVYRESTLATYRAAGVPGYRRVAAKSDRTCAACLLLDGHWFPAETAFEEHVQGRCTAIPERDPDGEPGWTTGREWFEELPEDRQRLILGKGHYEAWQRGDITLDDIPKLHVDPVWGNSWQVRSLQELLPKEEIIYP